MADEILRSKHGFGNLVDVMTALETGKIDAYDILFLDGDTEPKIGWIDRNSNFRLVKNESVIVVEENSLPTSGVEGKVYIFNDEGYFWNGTEFVNFCKPTDVTELSGRLTTLESNYKTLESDLEKLDTTVVDLKAEVEKLQSDVSGLQTDVKDLQTSISDLQTEIDKKANIEDVQADIEQAKLEVLETAKSYTDEKVEDVLNTSKHLFENVKYEITNTPVGTLVNYSEKEIRVMCPANTQWVKQSVGETGNANMYYMAFKAYAPEGAVSFKEGDQGVIIDKMFTFDDDFAGTDEFGRNYSICWLALALYDESSDTWTYFGKNSSTSKYIGWTYVVEWYDANGVVIASDSVRINLSNEWCHSSIEPFYINNATIESKKYTDEQIVLTMEV